jgi:hypothetical protein
MPAGTVKIDRSTEWGNPFRVGATAKHPLSGRRTHIATSETSIALYRAWLKTPAGQRFTRDARRELRGRNLACWCKPGAPCHGDVLLRIANTA